MEDQAPRRGLRWRWVLAAVLAAAVAVVVVLASWSGQCFDYVDAAAEHSECTSGPSLGVPGVAVLVGDLGFLLHAVRRARARAR